MFVESEMNLPVFYKS